MGKAGHLDYENLDSVVSYQLSTVRIKDLDKLDLVNLAFGGKVLGSSSFSLPPLLPHKIMLASKVVKIDSIIIILRH